MYLKLKAIGHGRRPKFLVPLSYPGQHGIIELFGVYFLCGTAQLVLVGKHKNEPHPLEVHVAVCFALLLFPDLLSFKLH